MIQSALSVHSNLARLSQSAIFHLPSDERATAHWPFETFGSPAAQLVKSKLVCHVWPVRLPSALIQAGPVIPAALSAFTTAWVSAWLRGAANIQLAPGSVTSVRQISCIASILVLIVLAALALITCTAPKSCLAQTTARGCEQLSATHCPLILILAQFFAPSFAGSPLAQLGPNKCVMPRLNTHTPSLATADPRSDTDTGGYTPLSLSKPLIHTRPPSGMTASNACFCSKFIGAANE